MNETRTPDGVDPDLPIKPASSPGEALIHRLLPPEIFTEIFYWCIPPFLDYAENDPTSIPLELGAVCHAWRTIAWSCPALWSSLTLIYSNTRSTFLSTLLGEWLSRSGELPLSIRLCDDGDSTHLTLREVVDVINAYSARWYEMDFRLSPETYQYLPSDTILPLLRYCSFVPVERGLEPSRSNAIAFSKTPQLRHLSLGCSIVYPRSLTFQWELLTSFEIVGFFVDECLEILRRSPNLINLFVHEFLPGDDEFAVPAKPFKVDNLRNMKFINSEVQSVDFAILFDKLIVPGAQKFEYTGKPRTGFPAQQFVSFINRSGCLLTSLSFFGRVPLTETDLVIILTATPALISFCLFAYLPLTDKIWRLLNPTTPEPPCLVRHLESLAYNGPQDFSWQVLLDTITARCSGPEPHQRDSESPTQDGLRLASFRSLSLFLMPWQNDAPPSPIPQSVEIGFEQLRKSGRKIDIKIDEYRLP